MLRSLVSMSLHRLASLTAAGLMPPKAAFKTDEFGTTVHNAEAGVSSLLRQRDQSLAKLLGLAVEYHLLSASSGKIARSK
jgi:hypothetical protein